MLIFRDVLEWRVAGVADVLGISTTAVNSLLLDTRLAEQQTRYHNTRPTTA